MPQLKEILIRQTAIPMNLEKNLPVGLPKVSQFMAQAAAAMPSFEVPEIPMMAAGAPAFPAQITQVIRGVEDSIPLDIPKLSQNIQAFTAGGYRPVEEEKKPNQVRRVLGGGYRSIS